MNTIATPVEIGVIEKLRQEELEEARSIQSVMLPAEPLRASGVSISHEFQPVARWKSGMSEDQRALVDTLVGETLKELGYTAKNEPIPRTDQKNLQRMRSLYQSYFSTKFLLKSKTALGRTLVTRDLSWV